MKMAGKQTTLLFIALIALILLCYFVFIHGPESDKLVVKNTELQTVQAEKKRINDRIAAGEGLNAEIESYKKLITDIEKSLLPDIETQVIAQILQDKFVDHGIPFITKTNTSIPTEERVLLPDGTQMSDEALISVIFNLQVCGTDGFHQSVLDDVEATEPSQEQEDEQLNYILIGYDEFISALKDIEDDLPDSVKIRSITLEDSGQGFMYYSVSVVAYTMYLPNRISEPSTSGAYITWNGIPVNQIPREGLIGIPYDRVPETLRDDKIYLPFAFYPTPAPVDTEEGA